MKRQLQISARGVVVTEDLDRFIRREAAKLETFYPRIMGCRVLVETDHRFPRGEPVGYAVRIDLTVPQDELSITHQRADTLRTAVQRAFDAARRQLQDYARIQRGDVGVPV